MHAEGLQPDDGSAPRYRNPALAVDGVILHRRPEPADGERFAVLLIERGREPFRGRFALPGGFVDYGEDPEDAIHRELTEETGLQGLPLRQFRAFGDPDRDPRGHVVSLVYVAVVIGEEPPVQGGDDAADAAWFPLHDLPELAFDHDRILARVLETVNAG